MAGEPLPDPLPSDRRIDATRGCVVLERGPIVYALETADLSPGVRLEDVEVDPAVVPQPEPRDDLAGGMVGLTLPGVVRGGRQPEADTLALRAIPYYAWANRRPEAMRVWIPATRGDAD